MPALRYGIVGGGFISGFHLRGICAVRGIEVAGLVAKKALSVRDTEALVRRLMSPAAGASMPGDSSPRDPDIHRLELELADKLGARVMFQHTASGKGKLVVTYNSLDELEGILAHIT